MKTDFVTFAAGIIGSIITIIKSIIESFASSL